MAKAAQGSLLQIGDGGAPQTWLDVAAVLEVSGPAVARLLLETTDLAATGPGFSSVGPAPVQATFRCLFDPDEATHDTVIDRSLDGVSSNWRLHLSDFGTELEGTVIAATDKWTTAAAHGWETGQPVRLRNAAGALPASTPQVVAGTTYYARVVDADEVTLHLTAADAVANANIINFTGTGTGTHYLARGERWTFAARVRSAGPGVRRLEWIEGTVTLEIAGAVAVA